VLLGCALRRSAVAALTNGLSSGGFTPEATVGARHANTPELSVVPATLSACRPLLPLAVAATDNELLASERAAGIGGVKRPDLLPRCGPRRSCLASRCGYYDIVTFAEGLV
jgi:hypothetical protein